MGGRTDDAGRLADYPLARRGRRRRTWAATCSGEVQNTTAWVIRKSSVLGTGPIVVTAFRQCFPSATGAGIYAPRGGVTNPDPTATTGCFIGSDNSTLSHLVIRRVTNADTTPVMGPSVNITVPATVRPVNVPALGSTIAVEVTNDRLFDARFLRNHLTASGP